MAFVYIVTNKPKGSLYVGVTNNLARRAFEHTLKARGSYTAKYNLDKLVYAEEHSLIYDAISREKQLKNWRRVWKIELIESINPNWDNLFNSLIWL